MFAYYFKRKKILYFSRYAYTTIPPKRWTTLRHKKNKKIYTSQNETLFWASVTRIDYISYKKDYPGAFSEKQPALSIHKSRPGY